MAKVTFDESWRAGGPGVHFQNLERPALKDWDNDGRL